MQRYSKVNPLTCEHESRVRFCRDAIVIRLTPDEASAVEFAQARGYLPTVARLMYRDDGAASWRMVKSKAYAWAEQADTEGFCACLAPSLAALFHAADFRIRDSWAV